MNEQYVIFGAGYYGIQFFMAANFHISAFVDNNPELQGKSILGVPIVSPEEILKMNIRKIYVSSYYKYDEIVVQLLQMGVDKDIISLEIIEKEKKTRLIGIRGNMLSYLSITDGENKHLEYEEKWKTIKNRYNEIQLFNLYVDAIGELIPRLFSIMRESKAPDVLKVFLPDMQDIVRVCNKELLELVRQIIYVPQAEEILFWDYVLRNHREEIHLECLEKFRNRKSFNPYKVQAYINPFSFKKDRIYEAESVCKNMKICCNYVCMAARSIGYNKKEVFHESDFSFRNSNFEDYNLSINYLNEMSVQTIRMGREDKEYNHDNLVDYASKNPNEWMDIYLASRAKGFVSGPSGIALLASLFGIPLLFVNFVPLFGQGGIQYTEYDLYIPKKYYDINNNKYLSLREMVQVDEKAAMSDSHYSAMGIRIENNTPEEILDAVKEFMSRIDGTWVDNLQDKENYSKYLKIYKEMQERSRRSNMLYMHSPIPFRLSAIYLRKNEYLLD